MACSWSQTLAASASVHEFTATGNSLVVVLPNPMTSFGMQTLGTGGATISAQLQGSLNGTTWYSLGTASTSATGDYTAVVDKPSSYLRLALTITGGTAPTFKAWVAATI